MAALRDRRRVKHRPAGHCDHKTTRDAQGGHGDAKETKNMVPDEE